MSYERVEDRKRAAGRRAEQVRHLVRSVGVEMDDDVRVPFFVEPAPGKFRQNPVLKTMVIEDDRLCTLKVQSETPAKIPAGGLPVEALRYLIEIGLKGTDEL
jgi:hypothetical protein